MKKVFLLICAAAVSALILSCGPSKEGKVLVKINGSEVTEGTLDFLGTINPRIKAQIMSPDGKKRLVENIVEQELFYQKALKEGINRKPDVKAKIDLYRRVIIAQSLVDDEIEKAAKKYYDEHPEEFKKLALSQIMIRYANPEDLKKAKEAAKKTPLKLKSEADALKLANEVKARLDKGENFAALAKEYSDDISTKERGGDMGLIARDEQRMEGRGFGPLAEKAFEMKVGEIAGPIKTNSGYHIITVTKGIELEPFDEAKMTIMFKVRNDVRANLLKELKEKAKISYPEEEKTAAQKPEETKGTEAAQAPAAEKPAETGEAKVVEKTAPAVEEQKTQKPPAEIEVKPLAKPKKTLATKPVEEKKQ